MAEKNADELTDVGIIRLFFGRAERAISALSEKYGRLAYSLSLNILGNNQDAEECVSDALLAVWNSVPPKRPESLCAYFCSLVRNISFNRYDYNHASKRNGEMNLILDELEDVIASPEDENEEDRERIRGAINSFLEKEKPENRRIFVRRYYYSVSLSELASEQGEKSGAVAMRLSRMRERLKKELEKEGITL